MEFNEYQELSLRTAANFHDVRMALGITALGLTGEAGEVSDIVKKFLGHGHELDAEVITKELGDVLWYIAVMSDALNITLEDIAQKNIDKLKARYPDGFSTERSINRED